MLAPPLYKDRVELIMMTSADYYRRSVKFCWATASDSQSFYIGESEE